MITNEHESKDTLLEQLITVQKPWDEKMMRLAVKQQELSNNTFVMTITPKKNELLEFLQSKTRPFPAFLNVIGLIKSDHVDMSHPQSRHHFINLVFFRHHNQNHLYILDVANALDEICMCYFIGKKIFPDLKVRYFGDLNFRLQNDFYSCDIFSLKIAKIVASSDLNAIETNLLSQDQNKMNDFFNKRVNLANEIDEFLNVYPQIEKSDDLLKAFKNVPLTNYLQMLQTKTFTDVFFYMQSMSFFEDKKQYADKINYKGKTLSTYLDELKENAPAKIIQKKEFADLWTEQKITNNRIRAAKVEMHWQLKNYIHTMRPVQIQQIIKGVEACQSTQTYKDNKFLLFGAIGVITTGAMFLLKNRGITP